MRWQPGLVLAAWSSLAACHQVSAIDIDAAPTIDADLCARGPLNPQLAACVLDGFAGIDINGAWTFTGTLQAFGNAPMTATFPVTLTRTGTGWCQLGFVYRNRNQAPSAAGYVDDTHAYFHSGRDQLNYWTQTICAASDGSIQFHDDESQFFGDSPNHQAIDGTLSR